MNGIDSPEVIRLYSVQMTRCACDLENKIIEQEKSDYLGAK